MESDEVTPTGYSGTDTDFPGACTIHCQVMSGFIINIPHLAEY
jgi:hypothetical protein